MPLGTPERTMIDGPYEETLHLNSSAKHSILPKDGLNVFYSNVKGLPFGT